MKVLSLVLAGFLWLPFAAGAESPVDFADPVLKKAVEQTLWLVDPTPSDMLGLTSLRCCNSHISSLAGLQYAVNLRELSVMENPITDLSPLAGLTDLQSLNFQDTKVSNISPLSGLVNLQYLCMEDTLVSDLSPLLSLTSLSHLDVRSDPLNEEAYGIHIPQIEENNPGIVILHDRAEVRLRLSAGPGGSVVVPGEGEFTYEGRTDIVVEAKADPGFAFAGFSGNVTSSLNPMIFVLEYDSDIRANFISLSKSLYVDDDAPADPGPGNPTVSDPLENGTREHPFDRIQDAIEVAGKGATIFVQAGTYCETIDLLGKQLELTGFDPNDPESAAWPVLHGDGKGPVVSFTRGEDANCLLTGFVITGGKGRTTGAIRCTASGPTIANCLIAGNRATEWNGAAIFCTDSNAVFTNCTVVDNRGGQFGAGLSAVNGHVTVANSILWGNWPKEINYEGDYLPSVRYCTVAGGWPSQGNIQADPRFAGRGRWADGANPDVTVRADDPGAAWIMGDCHLQSQTGCWEPQTGQWRQDTATSPCIDAGDPVTPVGSEPSPNGGIINLGVYGGTAEASKSCPTNCAP
ncbi:MAG: hypothetical protein JW955_09260 [Sedimentisphaerales bacterium]|nr:hypothetical protein [Sedimentisphaerales bacterium]